MSQEELVRYQLQLEKLEIVLKEKPACEELLRLKDDLIDVIGLTQRLIASREEKNQVQNETSNYQKTPDSALHRGVDTLNRQNPGETILPRPVAILPKDANPKCRKNRWDSKEPSSSKSFCDDVINRSTKTISNYTVIANTNNSPKTVSYEEGGWNRFQKPTLDYSANVEDSNNSPKTISYEEGGWNRFQKPTLDYSAKVEDSNNSPKTISYGGGWNHFQKPTSDYSANVEDSNNSPKTISHEEGGWNRFQKPTSDNSTNIEESNNSLKTISHKEEGWNRFKKPTSDYSVNNEDSNNSPKTISRDEEGWNRFQKSTSDYSGNIEDSNNTAKTISHEGGDWNRFQKPTSDYATNNEDSNNKNLKENEDRTWTRFQKPNYSAMVENPNMVVNKTPSYEANSSSQSLTECNTKMPDRSNLSRPSSESAASGKDAILANAIKDLWRDESNNDWTHLLQVDHTCDPIGQRLTGYYGQFLSPEKQVTDEQPENRTQFHQVQREKFEFAAVLTDSDVKLHSDPGNNDNRFRLSPKFRVNRLFVCPPNVIVDDRFINQRIGDGVNHLIRYGVIACHQMTFQSQGGVQVQQCTFTNPSGESLVYLDTAQHPIPGTLAKALEDPGLLKVCCEQGMPGLGYLPDPLPSAARAASIFKVYFGEKYNEEYYFAHRWLDIAGPSEIPMSANDPSRLFYAVEQTRFTMLAIEQRMVQIHCQNAPDNGTNILPFLREALVSVIGANDLEALPKASLTNFQMYRPTSSKMNQLAGVDDIYRFIDSSKFIVRAVDFGLQVALMPPDHLNHLKYSGGLGGASEKIWKGLPLPTLQHIARVNVGEFPHFCARCASIWHRAENCSFELDGKNECLYPNCHNRGSHITAVCPALHSLCKLCGRRGHSNGDHYIFTPVYLDAIFYWWSTLGVYTCLVYLELVPARRMHLEDWHWLLGLHNTQRNQLQKVFPILGLNWNSLPKQPRPELDPYYKDTPSWLFPRLACLQVEEKGNKLDIRKREYNSSRSPSVSTSGIAVAPSAVVASGTGTALSPCPSSRLDFAFDYEKIRNELAWETKLVMLSDETGDSGVALSRNQVSIISNLIEVSESQAKLIQSQTSTIEALVARMSKLEEEVKGIRNSAFRSQDCEVTNPDDKNGSNLFENQVAKRPRPNDDIYYFD